MLGFREKTTKDKESFRLKSFLNTNVKTMRKLIKFKKFGLLYFVIVFIMMLMVPAVSFAFTRGKDGYNYYNYDQRTVGGNIFGGSSFGGGLFCSGSSYLNFCSVINYFLGIIGALIPILFSIAVVVFIWGVFRYVIAEGEDKQVGKNVMIYGVIGLFVMVSVWGLVNLVYNTFGLDNNNYYFNSGVGGEGTTDSFGYFFKQFLGSGWQ